jgi:hemerythrin-like domain-containing protein
LKGFGGMEMEETLKLVLSELKEMRSDMNGLKEDVSELKQGQKRLEEDLSELKQGQERLEEGQKRLQQNLIDSLGSYTEKIIEHVDDKTEVLNRRVFNVEIDIRRLGRQYSEKLILSK